jgi:hypothetical protein
VFWKGRLVLANQLVCFCQKTLTLMVLAAVVGRPTFATRKRSLPPAAYTQPDMILIQLA